MDEALVRSTCQGVMLVEDDVDLVRAEVQVLRDEGYAVTWAANGAEALRLLRTQGTPPPCMILLDIMMPVMDGWEFRARQVSDPELAAIPVVILTADSQAVEKSQSMGAAAALTKPITATKLIATVQTFCRPA